MILTPRKFRKNWANKFSQKTMIDVPEPSVGSSLSSAAFRSSSAYSLTRSKSSSAMKPCPLIGLRDTGNGLDRVYHAGGHSLGSDALVRLRECAVLAMRHDIIERRQTRDEVHVALYGRMR